MFSGSESMYSSSNSSQLTKSCDVTHVKPFTLQSDQSDDDGEEDNSSTNSFTTQPAVIKSYSSLARQSGATRKTGCVSGELMVTISIHKYVVLYLS